MQSPTQGLADPGRLAALHRLRLLDSPAEEAYDRLAQLGRRLLGAPVCLVSLVDDRRQFFKAMPGLSGPAAEARGTPLSHSFCQHVVTSAAPLVVDDARANPLVCDNGAVADLGVAAYLGVPFFSPEGHALGSFCVLDSKPREWSEGDLQVMTELAHQVSTLIALRSEVEERQRAEQALLAARAAREAELAFNNSVLDSTVYSIIATDPSGVIQVFNRGAEVLLGYTREEVVGKVTPAVIHDLQEVVDYAAVLSRELGFSVEPGFETFVAKAKQRGADEREWTYVRKDGSRFPVRLSVTAMRSPTGEIFGYLGIASSLVEQKRAERERAEFAARLKKLGDQVPGVIYQYRLRPDGSSCFPFASEGIRAIYGVSPTDVADDASAVIAGLHPDDKDAVIESITRSASNLGPWECEYRFVQRSGAIRWLRGRSVPEREPDGSILWHGMIMDVTQQKASELFSEALVQISPVGIYRTDELGNCVYVNKRWEEITGVSSAAAMGEGWASALHPDDRVRLFSEWNRSVAEDRPFESEYRFRHADGGVAWVIGRAFPQRDRQGRVLGYVGSVEDVTSLKQALLARQNQQTALDSHAIVAITDVAGTITYANDRFCAISGFSLAELIGANHRILNSGYHPREFFTGMFRFVSTGQTWHGEICNRAKDGRLYWVDTTIVPFRDHSGKVEQYVSIRTDITARKLAEAELLEAKEAAEAASRVKSEFLAAMSHEIRTPMNGIIGMAELLGDTGLGTDQAKMLRVIRTSGENLLRIINDVLDLSKLEAGRMTSESGEFSLAEMVNDVCTLVGVQARSKQVGVSSVFEGVSQGLVRGDAGRLQQVLTNLVGNAVKFTAAGNVRVRVMRGKERTGSDAVRIEVSDTGIGISAEGMRKLFQPFSQVDSGHNRCYGGTGLGLAISKQLVELMGGQIGCESTLGQGSTFWVELTLPATAAAERVSEAGGNRPGIQGGGQRVLVVEDNEANQLVSRIMLEKLGHSVAIAGDSEAALSLLAEQRFDLVFLDCQMPGRDGFETIRLIRSGRISGIDKAVHVIALTAYALAGDRDVCLAAGMDDYVAKPVTLDALRKAIERARTKSKRADEPAMPIAPPEFDTTILAGLAVLPGRRGSLANDISLICSEELPARFEHLASALDGGDLSGSAELLHKIAGSCASVGALGLQRLGLELEAQARAGAIEEVRAGLARLRDGWTVLQKYLTLYLPR
ncbi:PAS domain S-box protein [Nibricoccus sp. IMCC34717]|uniref:PAS domain S-box protein n=1 Tax=Nibricoccus sp. IMCC34717 TaxID=3034021 RepID=UPI00384EE23C